MKMNDDELFAKLSEAFEELYGPSDSEDTPVTSPFDKDPVDPFDYDGEEYVVLLPKDESDDAGEVVILKVDETDSEDEETYTSVDDEKTLQAVFNIFREKFKDEFNFED